MGIDRWKGSSAGRSRASVVGDLVWLVANALNPTPDFRIQVCEALSNLDATLRETNSSRSRLVSVQVLLTDMANKPAFDEMWLDWIGPDPRGWPQRSCIQVGLAPGLLVELVVVAARE